MKWTILALTLMIALTHFTVVADTTPEETCKEAAKLYAEGDLDGALEEAKWCVSQMEQEKQQQVKSVFPDKLDGFVGEATQQEGAMGFTMLSKTYKKGNNTINVMLNGGASGSALQAFSALAQLGIQTGAGEKVRIQKRTALVSQDGDMAKVLITMRSGGMLTFESSNMSSNDLVDFAKKFPISELDETAE